MDNNEFDVEAEASAFMAEKVTIFYLREFRNRQIWISNYEIQSFEFRFFS